MNPPPNEPAPTAPFTDEDRRNVRRVADDNRRAADYGWEMNLPGRGHDARADSLTRALAYITHLEGALEAADELESRAELYWGITNGPEREDEALEAALTTYRSTRAALPTSKED